MATGCSAIRAPDASTAPATLTDDQVIAPDAAPLALTRWTARGGERAVILALHGFGDAALLTFTPAAEAWSAAGITTYAYDQRGFGANPSRRQWPGPAVLIDDLRATARAVRAAHPGRPLLVVGHSMGGGVALAAAPDLAADGVVLAAPAIAGDAGINPFLRVGAWFLNTFLPKRRFTGDGVVSFLPTDNLEVLRFVARHPLSFGDPSGEELLGLVLLSDRAAAAAADVTLPTLTLIGARDEVIRPAAIRRVAETIGGRAEIRTYPEGWHWLFRDLQAPLVWGDVAAFALSLPRPET